MSVDKKVLVVDNGTGVCYFLFFIILCNFKFCKAGFAGDKLPSFYFHSMVGRPMVRSEEIIDNVKIKVFIFICCCS
jgi:hypothetical protein